ncbi:MAG: metalloregulator ArsR/SmtB family transcription factor [Nanoarchaeota archaeon]|nr:metalloregulator ArsR/SmtB family transcription factor [Nanoarchaeota archaeon]MBU4116485.1 metalloregulator ArsR/SmtB family transcription factor [Nanoarchaeota archaeon]
MNSNTYHVFFTNLANPLKINIILNLREKEKNVSDISNELRVEQSKVSHALSSLKCCNIVEVKQKGKQRIYFLNKKTIVPMLNLIDKHASTFCGSKCRGCR